MPITDNNIAAVDLPSWQVLQPLPVASAAGTCMCNDKRGTGRYIYILITAANFWRYDVWSNTYQQLASPPGGTVGTGTAMIFDPSRGTQGYVWALISNGVATPTWQYYDCYTNSWTARSVTNLPATFGTDACIAHPCTAYGAAASDDGIYLVGNNATPLYCYWIATNAWVTGKAVTGSAGAGCALLWNPTYSTTTILCIRGGATTTVYEYTIATNTWAAPWWTIYPATETFTTGSMIASNTAASTIWIQKDATQRIYKINIGTGEITPQATQYLIAPGTVIVGDRLLYVKETNGIDWLYFGVHTATSFLRTPVFF